MDTTGTYTLKMGNKTYTINDMDKDSIIPC